ncbi:helix-turn-helix domain-containing protein [Corynebacterium suedekumii]|uniref:Helix-turn-helix transcriptional regulator n=1 Tax=Corynebacterium suedekumii TaxID=3049801 RepID=A0ABY8VQU4_9CORY|nr:helix-turn-helix transcriptional regulator [Corynebacterium suedekumii]WIM71033.1 helix-turn-helix transcriptional regulator [Corynebacterium suedekumii]
MTMTFRNVDAHVDDDPASWPFEAKIIAVERGVLSHYHRIVRACRRDPQVAQEFLEACDVLGREGGAGVVAYLIEGSDEGSHRRACAFDMRRAVEMSGLSQNQVAEVLGTSASRLSTYLAGRVVPSAVMQERILALAPPKPWPVGVLPSASMAG